MWLFLAFMVSTNNTVKKDILELKLVWNQNQTINKRGFKEDLQLDWLRVKQECKLKKFTFFFFQSCFIYFLFSSKKKKKINWLLKQVRNNQTVNNSVANERHNYKRGNSVKYRSCSGTFWCRNVIRKVA